MHTIEWTVSEFKAAGLKDAKVETYAVPGAMWVPQSWQLQIVGDPAFGAGTQTVTLQSAFPQPGGATIPGGSLTAPVVYVGHGTDADLAGRDVKGKIAVVRVRPEPSLFGAGEQGVAAKLVEKGAAGVINAIEGPGNAQYVDPRFACGKSPCFMVGGQDAWFLQTGDRQGGQRGRARQAEDQHQPGVRREERADVRQRHRDDSGAVRQTDHHQRARGRLLSGRRRQRQRPRGARRAREVLREAAAAEAHADVRGERRPPRSRQRPGVARRGASRAEGRHAADPEPRTRGVRRRRARQDARDEQHRHDMGNQRDGGGEGGRRHQRVAVPDRSLEAGVALLWRGDVPVGRPDRVRRPRRLPAAQRCR